MEVDDYDDMADILAVTFLKLICVRVSLIDAVLSKMLQSLRNMVRNFELQELLVCSIVLFLLHPVWCIYLEMALI